MDNILSPIQDALEGQIDFHGQQITEIFSTALLVVSGVVASLIGYIFQDIHLSLWAGLAGTLLTALIIIPPWPIYNKHPEKWLVPFSGRAGVTVDGVKVA
ncbi:signal peptidase complex subunit 1 [Aspergillus puulaauensis]|uniref:Signal peptidase complex subunit 1 n=1 Tax=Aspergillus puulaauensis TaxID=1220207 RepID=A0A7R7XW83_9EURO|nr:uncharacterized protein APUU_70422S [Aspergillus puulaauensis]BCS28852.1 hypothetical protein APUU_70422S [Aspergillus puulaauensis]